MAGPAWNVLATSLEGQRDALLVALRRFGRFRPGGYRNVVVGKVDDVPAFLDQVQAALASEPPLRAVLARIVPIEVTLRFEPDGPVDPLVAALGPLLPRLAGGAFYVRVHRRGLKGRVHSPTVEREIGDHVWRALVALGHTPRVAFADPDAVLLIETLGDQAGLAVIPRALRAAHPFVRVN